MDTSNIKVSTLRECQSSVTGIVNDYKNGIYDEFEFDHMMGEFVLKLHNFLVDRANLNPSFGPLVTAEVPPKYRLVLHNCDYCDTVLVDNNSVCPNCMK